MEKKREEKNSYRWKWDMRETMEESMGGGDIVERKEL